MTRSTSASDGGVKGSSTDLAPGVIGFGGTGAAGRFTKGSAASSYALLTEGGLKLTGIGEAAGKVLTSDAAGNATWQTPGGGGSLTLPYAGSIAAPMAFSVTNSAPSSTAILGKATNTTNTFTYGVAGEASTTTTGNMSAGVRGYTVGTGSSGSGVMGQTENASGCTAPQWVREPVSQAPQQARELQAVLIT